LKIEDPPFHDLITKFVGNNRAFYLGGVKKIEKKVRGQELGFNFGSFIKSRFSARLFAVKVVPLAAIHQAVDLARFSPSVCNRQGWKVYHYDNRDKMNLLLKIQNGNNGFTHSINQLLKATSDTKKFTKMASNQVFVDGGLFSRSLLLSLHSKGIASCCLNTCLPFVDEVKVKNIGNIAQSERLIMMIGIGLYKDVFEVAISDRVAVEEILMSH
jgi:hypothetical protein